ncbi:SPOR domain-containing protein [Enterovibrio sp. ZSDZ35]|uniref:SPOR domain-containing protein n=1 Tax=Enterovibrio qingdaonensis TaxID=2899818 RepID=A0ABT5QLU4_9GAMM|nr:SPOR domain-containing protein [Enterovibrio sp. ZSDZ35]MDD1781960.1 SPOR domain-containing protein [Enterovibrio sp. ZSDZ35]
MASKPLVLLCFLLSYSTSLLAKVNVCVPETESGWNVVSNGSCPIGEGLWESEPESNKGQFWVQCGMLTSLPEKWFATDIKRSVLQDQIILLQEGGYYRCLAGPYDTFSTAHKVRNAMRKQPALKTAFIREVKVPLTHAKSPSNATPIKAMTEPTSEKEASVEAIEAATLAVLPEALPEPAIKDAVPKKVVRKVPRDKRSRKYFDVAGLQSPKPKSQEQRYTDGERSWWRATYDEAFSACERDGMELVSMEKLRSLARDSETRAAFPKRLPYWVKEQKAFDIVMMVPMPLRESSLIHVLCEE